MASHLKESLGLFRVSNFSSSKPQNPKFAAASAQSSALPFDHNMGFHAVIFQNIQFSDFECDLLIRSEEMLESVVELWNARMDATNKQNKELDKSAGQRQMVVGAADSKHDLHPGSECTSDPTSPTHTTGSANTTTDAGAEEEPDVISFHFTSYLDIFWMCYTYNTYKCTKAGDICSIIQMSYPRCFPIE